ncbi:MAG: glycosyltransferase family 2 protein [Nitrospirae bacterium]|nr:glycosyltransferase family 2 protein [Nitrospirota bacterium]
MEILVLVPAYNEEGKVGSVVSDVKKHTPYNVVVVDDGSTDRTAAEARSAGAEIVQHGVNRGVGAALRTGFGFALKNGYEAVVVMGADAQDHAEEIPRLLLPMESDGCDFVQGSRRLGGLRAVNITLFRRVTTWVYSALFGLITGFRLTDGTNGFRAFRTRILKDPRLDLSQPWLDRYELEPYLMYRAIKLGYKLTEAPVTKYYHMGELSYTKMTPFRDWWSILRPLIFLRLGLRK